MKWNWKHITIGALLVGAGFAGGVQVGSESQKTANAKEQAVINSFAEGYKAGIIVEQNKHKNDGLDVDIYSINERPCINIKASFGGKDVSFSRLEKYIPNDSIINISDDSLTTYFTQGAFRTFSTPQGSLVGTSDVEMKNNEFTVRATASKDFYEQKDPITQRYYTERSRYLSVDFAPKEE